MESNQVLKQPLNTSNDHALTSKVEVLPPKPKGGARPGAGRPPKPKVTVKKASAETILAAVDEKELWTELLNSDNEKIRLEALRYLTDRRDGKPCESVMMRGEQELKLTVLHIGQPPGQKQLLDVGPGQTVEDGPDSRAGNP
jgi:hypothetical protein